MFLAKTAVTRRRAGIGLLIAVALVVISAFIWVALKDDIGPYRSDGAIVAPNVPMTYAPPTLDGNPSARPPGHSNAPGLPGGPNAVPGGGPCLNHAVVNKPQGPGRAGSNARHTAVIRAWSASPIPQIAVVAPTARLWVQEWCASASVSWTVTVWGPGPYAQIFIGGAAGSGRITCSIAIDGIVRTTQSTAVGGGVQFCRA